MSQVKVAAVHASAPFLDLEGSVEHACDMIQRAASQGAGVIVFPETYLPGYPYWIWSHTAKHAAPLFAELFANSPELPSGASQRIAAAASEAGAWVVMGMDEREGGTLYNTLAYFSPEDGLIARHRKLQPTNAERTVWGRGDGQDIFVVDTGFGRLGGLICFEHTMDLASYSMATLGEQIHISVWPAISAANADPNSSSFDHYSSTLASSYAIRNQCFVIMVQGRIDQRIVDKLGVSDADDIPTIGGGLSGVLGPDGQWIAGPHRDDEAIILADLDLSDISFAKFFADSAGHYARPDVFTFGINHAPSRPLSRQGIVRTGNVLTASESASEEPHQAPHN